MTDVSNASGCITAAHLYNFMVCEHRVWRDVYGPQEERLVETNPFVQLLWDRGVQHERRVVEQVGDYKDISDGALSDRFTRTKEALYKGVPQIYQGVLIHDNLLGIPDILRLQKNGTYIPVEIKSGMAFEGANDQEPTGKPKKTYAVQLALYVELLEPLGVAEEKKGIVIDIDANEIAYDLSQAISTRIKTTYWELYQQIKGHVERLHSNESANLPALGGVCNLCAWHNSCHKWAEESDDLTGLFYMGKTKRDVIVADVGINTIQDAVDLDIDRLLQKKKEDKAYLKGIASKTLHQIKTRANIVKNVRAPVLHEKIDFPSVSTELFFDIEDDPTQEFVYLHGVLERTAGRTRYLAFTSPDVSEESERRAWSEFWDYIDSLPEGDFAVFYYAPHEKSTYRRMQKKYPDVISGPKLEQFFDGPNVIDLYTSIVLKNTDWPLGSYSLKALATYLGFEWRDETPSGALSIQWFNEYLKTGEETILERILQYNEDDCKAAMVLKDKLQELSDGFAEISKC